MRLRVRGGLAQAHRHARFWAARACVTACQPAGPAPTPDAQAGGGTPPAAAACRPPAQGEAALPGGRFLMAANPVHPEEGPPKQISVGAFSIDRTEVTNRAFAAFVAATGYVTEAERPLDPALYPNVPAADRVPSSLVFRPGSGWDVVAGADWRHPDGPGSTITDKMDHPVVQVSQADALAYARWKGRDLPTEAEWEYAARGGLAGAKYVWGNAPEDPKKANYWQGVFPIADTGADGFKGQSAPVGCFPANGFGLFDMSGNVWEWTSSRYVPPPNVPEAPSGLIKGGSFLCANNFCYRFRPDARQGGPPDTGASHVGFRTIKR